MFIEERHKKILEMLQKNKSITNQEIQDMFGISYDSAKRDLRLLEEQGMLKRTHGGVKHIREILHPGHDREPVAELLRRRERKVAAPEIRPAPLKEQDRGMFGRDPNSTKFNAFYGNCFTYHRQTRSSRRSRSVRPRSPHPCRRAPSRSRESNRRDASWPTSSRRRSRANSQARG